MCIRDSSTTHTHTHTHTHTQRCHETTYCDNLKHKLKHSCHRTNPATLQHTQLLLDDFDNSATQTMPSQCYRPNPQHEQCRHNVTGWIHITNIAITMLQDNPQHKQCHHNVTGRIHNTNTAIRMSQDESTTQTLPSQYYRTNPQHITPLHNTNNAVNGSMTLQNAVAWLYEHSDR